MLLTHLAGYVPGMTRFLHWILLFVSVSVPATAQESASFRLFESTLNAGGSPQQGQTGGSASFRISHDALGDAALGRMPASQSFRLDGGFVQAFGPVGEVIDLVFDNPSTLSWNAASTALTYNGYRGLIENLSGLDYGGCQQQGLATNVWQDFDVPANGYFYLVTGIGRLREEGTKGVSSQGAQRLGTVCP